MQYPRHALAATNPCHVWDLKRALHGLGVGGTYYSGYPAWRLHPPPGMEFVSASTRTLITYGLMRVPERWRPDSMRLFLWQDEGFDRAISKRLRPADFFHGVPGQCLYCFRRARELGLQTVFSHASGPFTEQLRLIAPEYARAGYPFNPVSNENQVRAQRIREEEALADWHWAASTVVRDQLVAQGTPADRIWVIPYGADPEVFPKSLSPVPGPFKILFAGQQTLRKGIFYLLEALKDAPAAWTLNCYGPRSRETDRDYAAYAGAPQVNRHGPLTQAELGQMFARHHVLVLPSAEEAFGLVVVQALQCGLPCIVSDRVGAKDLIRHRENGSIVPFGDAAALQEELRWWEAHPRRVETTYGWEAPAQKLLELSLAVPASSAKEHRQKAE